MMLLDILLALALATIFVSGMTAASFEARDIFERAKTRSDLVHVYLAHADDFASLMPYESRVASYPYATTTASTSSAVTVEAHAHWYGNDRIETDIASSYEGESVSFVTVRAYTFDQSDDAAGTPLCSPNILSADTVGSYAFDHPTKANTAIDISPITLPVDPLLPFTDVEVRNGIAYISIDSSTVSDPDLVIADISDPKHPHILSVLNTGPGIAAIALAGKYVFAAAASTAAELHVIRIDSLTLPVLVKKYRLPLPEASTTPPSGTAIFYDRHKIYLGTDRWDGDEFSVIDVSVPESPVKIGGFEIGSKVNDILVRDKVAYVAASDQMQLRALDISNPASTFVVRAFSPSGWQRQEGKTLNYLEDSLGFGRTSGGFDIVGDHEWFRWQTASSVPDIAAMPISVNIPGGIYGIVADRDHVYAATRTPGQELAILDPSLSTTTAVHYSLPVAPQAIACDGRKLYVLAHTAPVIYEITKSQIEH